MIMGLKPEVSIMTGLTVAALVWTIYNRALPADVDMRVAAPNDDDIEASRRKAGYTAAAAVSAVSLIAKDATVFILGGATLVAVDWWARHANAVNPELGKAFIPGFNAGAPNTNPALQDPTAGPVDPGYTGGQTAGF
jgi:hypothetical protein